MEISQFEHVFVAAVVVVGKYLGGMSERGDQLHVLQMFRRRQWLNFQAACISIDDSSTVDTHSKQTKSTHIVVILRVYAVFVCHRWICALNRQVFS